jgi:integrase
MPRRRKRSRIYWRDRGGERRAYADFRDFSDVGGGREALVPKGAKIATADPAVAEAVAGARLQELQERRRNKNILGRERQANLKDFAAHHLLQKSNAGRVTAGWLATAEVHLRAAVEFFGPDTDLQAVDPPSVSRFVQQLARTPSGRGQTCPECGRKGVHAESTRDPLRWACKTCRGDRGQPETWQAAGLSPSTQRKYINSLSNLYRRAASEGYVLPGYNPVAGMLDKPTADRKEARWLEVHEAALLLETCRPAPKLEPAFPEVTHPKRRAFLVALAESGVRAHAAEAAGIDPTLIYTQPWRDDESFQAALRRCCHRARADMAIPAEQLHAVVATMLLTGGRKAEVLGLAVDDVSFDRRTVTFRPHPWRRLKTAMSHRTVPLWPQLEEILRAYVFAGQGPRGRLLFPSSRTEKEQPVQDVRKALDAVGERAGWVAGEIRTKMFRHTYCAARLQTLDRGAPVSPFTVARELGHGGQSLVHRVYGHLGDMRQRTEVVEYMVEDHLDRIGDRLRDLTVARTVAPAN